MIGAISANLGDVALSGEAAGRGLGTRLGAVQQDFSGVLGRAIERGETGPEQARKAAEQFVAIALVQPLLSQLRAANQSAPPFAPTQGEKQFQSLLDSHLAQEITRSKNFPLVDRLAADLMKRAGHGRG